MSTGFQPIRVSGSLSSVGPSVKIELLGAQGVSFKLSGTWSGTFVTETSSDGEETWDSSRCRRNTQDAILSSFVLNVDSVYTFINVSGVTHCRVRFTSLSSGIAYIMMTANNSSHTMSGNMQSTAQTIPPYVAIVGGSDGTLSRVFAVVAKGIQGAFGLTTHDMKDTGRNQTNYFMAVQILSTAAEALQLLTGYKAGAAVAETTTPAVVTAAKTYRIEKLVVTYVAVAAAGAIQVNLRANTAGVVAIGSPLVMGWVVGAAAAVAGVAQTVVIDVPDGIEFAAGTGIGITVLGVGPTGAAAITGYAKVSVGGFEY